MAEHKVTNLPELIEAVSSMASAIRVLGLNNAATPQGAIEVLSGSIRDTGELVADAINNLADAISDAARKDAPAKPDIREGSWM